MKRGIRIFAVIALIVAIIVFVVPMLWPLPPVGVDAATLADPDGAFIDVNGLSTYYRQAGPQDGPVVLLLHGWGASTFSWRDTIPALAEVGYRVIAFDRPPYGLSAKTGANIAYSPGQMADFTAAFMDALGIERATLIGHSQGGGVIGYFAMRYPQRVDRLVFVSGAPRPTEGGPVSGGSGRAGGALGIPAGVLDLLDFPPFERWARILIRAFVRPDAFVSLQRSAYYDPNFVTPEVAAGYQKALEVKGWDEALLTILRGAAVQVEPVTAEQIAAISAPTLIVWGENDTWVPIEAGETLADLIAGEIFLRYPETGHLPMEERPARFNQDVIGFLAGDRPVSP
ncbi:MAG: alpha/beta fold hydrolase [Candidatus Flexifilum sp.]